MKILYIITIISSSFFTSYGQYTYIPLIAQNKYWIYEQNNSNDQPLPIGGFIFFFSSDTIINNFKYTKLVKSGLIGTSPCPDKPCFTPLIPYQMDIKDQTTFAFLREDTLMKKVYCLPAINNDLFCDSIEHELFDFNILFGDTLSKCNLAIHSGWPISEHYFTIDSINVEEIYERKRKVWYFDGFGYGGLPYISKMKLIEGIGLNKNLGFYLDSTVRFIDYCEGTLEYCNIALSNTKYNQLSNSGKITLTPNPVIDFIKLETELDVMVVEVIDNKGKIVLTSKEKEIDVSSLSPGLYIVGCIFPNKHQIYKKLVKL